MHSNKMNFFDIDLQYKKFKKKINFNVLKTLQSTQFILGKEVRKFEKKISIISKSKYAVGTSSGTDSLLIALLAIGIKKGDEVITTSFSWLSVAEVIILIGAKPIYVDININDFNIKYEEVSKKINKKTKAIITTSLFGYPCELDKLKKIANKNKVKLIEDSAQSFGAKISGKPLSNYADITCYSFFPSKILGAYGDAGGIVTNEKKIYKKIIAIRNHGQRKYGISNKFIGLNARIDEIQASVLNTKVKIYKEEIKKRKKVVNKFIKLLSDNGITGYTKVEKNKFHVYGQFSLLVKKRKFFINFFMKKGISTKIFYPQPLYKQYMQKLSIRKKQTEFCCKHIVSIPINIYSNKRFNRVYNCLKSLIKKNDNIFFKKKYFSN